ncbi:MAG: RsmD family RNA methyltransferase [Bacteroidales bacterium]|nr:RsmD family RNA methyltransferase [Bacteroidales bacterium]
MRIISGKFKGRRIELPKNFKARPTTDFAKEGLFDILEHRVVWEELNVLDLFSGTGFISYEFVSRGVAKVDAVEIEPIHARFIRHTAQQFNMPIKVFETDVFKFIERKCNNAYDIIFCDPPYDLKETIIIPEIIFSSSILSEDGLLIIEHDKSVSFQTHLHFLHERRYGKVHFSFFSKNSEKYFFR